MSREHDASPRPPVCAPPNSDRVPALQSKPRSTSLLGSSTSVNARLVPTMNGKVGDTPRGPVTMRFQRQRLTVRFRLRLLRGRLPWLPPRRMRI
jgi:hypothetical protein